MERAAGPQLPVDDRIERVEADMPPALERRPVPPKTVTHVKTHSIHIRRLLERNTRACRASEAQHRDDETQSNRGEEEVRAHAVILLMRMAE